jgi:hypothetical protein
MLPSNSTPGSAMWQGTEEMSASANDVDPVDRAGNDIFRELQLMAAVSEQNFQRAVISAHQTSVQLRAAENRIEVLQAECEVYREQAERGEKWLQRVTLAIEQAFSPGEKSERRRISQSVSGAQDAADLAEEVVKRRLFPFLT